MGLFIRSIQKLLTDSCCNYLPVIAKTKHQTAHHCTDAGDRGIASLEAQQHNRACTSPASLKRHAVGS